MTLDAVVVKVVGSMVTESPLATSIVPLLVKVVGLDAEVTPPLPVTSIVPLLVKAFGVDAEIAPAPGDVDCAVVDDPVAGIAAVRR